MYVEIDGWRSNLRFSACHFIPEYRGAPRVHGYTYTVNIRIHGTTNEQGIIMDFERIKTVLNVIVNRYDHKVIVPGGLIKNEDDSNVNFMVGDKNFSIPKDETVIVDLLVPSAEELCRIILHELIERLEVPENVERIELGLDESWGQGAWSNWTSG